MNTDRLQKRLNSKHLLSMLVLVALVLCFAGQALADGGQSSVPGTVVGWGKNSIGESSPPSDHSGIIAITAGDDYGLALESNGAIVGWGWNEFGQTTPPSWLTDATAIAAGYNHTLAIRSNGTVVGWGDDSYGQSTPPPDLSGVVAIAAGTKFSLALKSDGTVVGWGWNEYGQATPPLGLNSVIAIAAGWYHALALKDDGTVVAWGNNWWNQSTIPTELNHDLIAIAAGHSHNLALASDGTVVAWGSNHQGEIIVPPDLRDVSAIAAGYELSLALKTDGHIVAWGWDDYGQASSSTGLSGVTAIAAGYKHGLAIISNNFPLPELTVNAGGVYSVYEGSSVAVNATLEQPGTGEVTFAWDLDNNGSFESPGQSTLYSAAGIDGPADRTVKVMVVDGKGLTAVDEATVNVINSAPIVSLPVVVTEPSFKGNNVIASATFSDPGPNDAPFSCTVDYGDGSGLLVGAVSGTNCSGPSHSYYQVGSFVVTVNITDKDNDTGSNSVPHRVIYNFTGFFPPVDNLPIVNRAKSGQAIPIKFSLDGSQGLDIFAAGYPRFEVTSCSNGAVDAIEVTQAAGNSGLTYDPIADQYTYVWKTLKEWQGKCGKLVLMFTDGTTQTAQFTFTK